MTRITLNVGAALLIVAATGAGLQVKTTGHAPVLDQHVTVADLTQAELARFQPTGPAPAGLPILAYHDVRPDADDPFTVSPELFAEHMAMLHVAGFETVSLADVHRWLDGEAPLPERPVLITFDDGTSGVWRYAEPVMRRHEFDGVVFVITAKVGEARPYYMTWDELTRLQDTGRWELASHTHDSHYRLAIDDQGRKAPALTSRQWLRGEDRHETLAEYEDRITSDLDASIAGLREHGATGHRFFAFPFSSASSPTNDPQILPVLDGAIGARFRATMINVVPDRFATPADAEGGEMPRMEVFASTSTEQLHSRLQGADPLPLSNATLLDDAALWSGHGLAEGAVTAQPGSLTVAPVEDQPSVTLFYGEGRTDGWGTYRVDATVGGLDDDGDTTAGLLALAGSEDQLRISVSEGWVRVHHGLGSRTEVVVDHRIPAGERHRVAIELGPDRLRAGVDGRVVVAVVPKGGERSTGGVGVTVTRRDPGAPPVTFEDVRVLAPDA